MSDEAKADVEASGLSNYLLVGDQQIWLFTVFGKDEAADLTTDQKRQLRAAIDAELRARKAERQKHRRR